MQIVVSNAIFWTWRIQSSLACMNFNLLSKCKYLSKQHSWFPVHERYVGKPNKAEEMWVLLTIIIKHDIKCFENIQTKTRSKMTSLRVVIIIFRKKINTWNTDSKSREVGRCFPALQTLFIIMCISYFFLFDLGFFLFKVRSPCMWDNPWVMTKKNSNK